MPQKIAVFFHCLLFNGDPPQPIGAAIDIIKGQMSQMKESGLLQAADEFNVGINGGKESFALADIIIPEKAGFHCHGLQCKNECRTLVMLEDWLPGHENWNVLYFHSKGATRPTADPISTPWRQCMMRAVVKNWRRCVEDLDAGCDAVGAHWMEPPATPAGQYIFAGNFWWAKASFLMTLPSIEDTARVKLSGLDSAESRYESEVWLGNGPRKPIIKDYHGPGWNPGKLATCISGKL